jgi:hypothetical protein
MLHYHSLVIVSAALSERLFFAQRVSGKTTLTE